MVQGQLCTFDHLMNSGFGRPFPRHGLQLLFWFAKNCVTCKPIKSVLIIKLVSDCHPERGCYGFHLFGNIEELLPVLNLPRKKRKKQVVYYEVGNLNTETYPGSEDLPPYVTQNYGFEGDYNTDRLIISYQVKSRAVETVYVTKHDSDFSGSFSPDDTYEISSELIQALQTSHMDLTSFLTEMRFYMDIPVVEWYNEENYDYNEQMFDSYTDSAVRTIQSNTSGWLSASLSHEQTAHSNISITMLNNRLVTNYSEVPQDYRKPKTHKKPRAVRWSYIMSGLEQSWKGQGSDEDDSRSGKGRGFTLLKVLLGAGTLLLAVKCVSWLRSCSQVKETFPAGILRAGSVPLSYRHKHVMLDYIF
ncbi:uncharacterized protein LOC141808478 [Halichoeres trimaculatus]|uniref:uncharacterized protein LOC141808478 n=1 Tax=Halichoeres trimaculatus TaxID=147232 RepID=UPI003D9DD37C